MSWVLAFVMVKYFETAAHAFGMHASVFLFSVVTMFGAMFIILVIPETKGKSYDEIAAILSR